MILGLADKMGKNMSSEFVKIDKVIGASPEEARELNKPHDTPNKKGLSELKKGILAVTGVGTAIGGTAVVVEQGWIKPPAIIEQGQNIAEKFSGIFAPTTAEAAGPDYYESLPPQAIKEISTGVWFGAHTDGMSSALSSKINEYKNAGVSDELPMGIDKGSLFLKGPDGKFYEFAVGERGVYHSVGRTLMRALITRDLARGAIELASGKDFQLSSESKNIIANKPVTGDSGSKFPSLTQIRNSLTLMGAENPAPNKISQPLTFSWDAGADYQNGHNISGIFLKAMQAKAGSKYVEIFGLPVGEPIVETTVLGTTPTVIAWQPYERATLTYNPNNPQPNQVEGGLAGNQFIAALNHGDETLPAIGGQNNPPETHPYGMEEYHGNGWNLYNMEGALLSLSPANEGLLNSLPSKYPKGKFPFEVWMIGDFQQAQDKWGLIPSNFGAFTVKKQNDPISYDVGDFYRDGGKFVFKPRNETVINAFTGGDLSLLVTKFNSPIQAMITSDFFGGDYNLFNQLNADLKAALKLDWKKQQQ